MEIINVFGNEELARVYLGRMDGGEILEFVESVQPPVPRDEKWVLIISTLYGCPVQCKMCDASGQYRGRVMASEMFAQIDYLVTRRFPERSVPIRKFKIQFARMGEPSFNRDVLVVLRELPVMYNAPGLMPCISTIAPDGTEGFFDELIEVKNELFSGGRFQLQFSVHSTDILKRDFLMPVEKWDFDRIAQYGKRFYREGDRKIAINFAVAKYFPVDADVVAEHFDPEVFIVKLTPLNPTCAVLQNNLESLFCSEDMTAQRLVESFQNRGFEVILSIGELDENRIGSNCGQYVTRYLAEQNVYPPMPGLRMGEH
ncbi:MAG: radical SAM protein [Candidatus Cloacimonadota bacterium]|nr:MAG: radical SAM protein [Candidatus Cloacimonadota bacterium]